MRIAIIAHLAFPIGEPFHGGLEAHTHTLARELVHRGHAVTLFARSDSDPAFRLISPALEDVAGSRVQLFRAYLEIVTAIQRGGFDLVHNNSLHFLPLCLAHTFGCPTVTTFHSPPFPDLTRGVEIARAHPASAFVAVSAYIARQWADILPDCRVVHNSIEPGRWEATDTAAAGTSIWIGRFCPEKAPHYAILAARAAGFTLWLAGSIYDSVYFTNEVEPLLGGQVHYLGHLDHAGVSSFAGRASVGLFTSTWDEPFGLVIPEMLACGTPVVSFDSGAAAEILDDTCGIIVEKGDVAGMAAAMLAAGDLRRSDCRYRAEVGFPIDRMVSEYEAIYRQLGTAAPPRIAGA